MPVGGAVEAVEMEVGGFGEGVVELDAEGIAGAGFEDGAGDLLVEGVAVGGGGGFQLDV